jgi:hypothetical protein
MGRARLIVGGIIGAVVCILVTGYAIYLLIDALRTGSAFSPPAAR